MVPGGEAAAMSAAPSIITATLIFRVDAWSRTSVRIVFPISKFVVSSDFWSVLPLPPGAAASALGKLF